MEFTVSRLPKTSVLTFGIFPFDLFKDSENVTDAFPASGNANRSPSAAAFLHPNPVPDRHAAKLQ